jgi:hypothetical protein
MRTIPTKAGNGTLFFQTRMVSNEPSDRSRINDRRPHDDVIKCSPVRRMLEKTEKAFRSLACRQDGRNHGRNFIILFTAVIYNFL